MKRRIVWFSLTGLWLGFIFYNSSRNALESSEASGKFLEIANTILDFLNLEIKQSTLSFIIRKGAHFFEFFVLAILYYNCIKTFKVFKKTKILYNNVSIASFVIVLGLCLVSATVDESIQYFVPGRHSSILDVLIDFSGSLLAVILIVVINYKKIKSSLNKYQNL